MVIDTSSDRPLVHLVLRALTGRVTERRIRRGPYSPPACAVDPPGDRLVDPEVERECTALLRSLLLGEPLASALRDRLLPDVTLWSPAAAALFREAAVASLDVADDDGPLSSVTIEIVTVDVVAPRAFVVWRLAGRFTQPYFVSDDLLLEPTGQLVETSGVLVVTYRDGNFAAVHLYHDDLALLEQLVSVR